jgi:Lon protease-like protein
MPDQEQRMPDEPQPLPDVPEILPVFPLPNIVLFPHTLLPLHIFEPRYRVMVRHVTEADGLIVISRMIGDGFEELGSVGKVRELVPLEDGRFNLMLEGLHRVTMTEIPSDTPYRQVRVKLHPELPVTDEPADVERSKLETLATLSALLSVAQAGVPVVLNQEQPFEVVVNKACAGLPVDAAERQRLLAENDLMQRQRMLSKHLEDVIESVARTRAQDQGGSSTIN